MKTGVLDSAGQFDIVIYPQNSWIEGSGNVLLNEGKINEC
jgi:hypothetical protein